MFAQDQRVGDHHADRPSATWSRAATLGAWRPGTWPPPRWLST